MTNQPTPPSPALEPEFLRQALDAGGMDMWEWDLATGRIQLHGVLRGIMGYSAEEFEDHVDDWMQMIHADDREHYRERVRQHLAGEAPCFEAEYRLLRKDGGVVWVLSRGRARHDVSGKAVALLGVSLDITRRKQAELAKDQERRRLYTLLDRLPAFVCLIAPDYSVPFANRQFRELFGDPDARPCYAVMHERSTPCELCPTFDVFDTRALAAWEWQCHNTGNTYQIYDYFFEDLDGSPLVLELGIDETQKTKARQALAESEERYRSITDNLPMGIALIDRGCRVASANPVLRKWFPSLDFEAGPHVSDMFPRAAQGPDCGCEPVFHGQECMDFLFEVPPSVDSAHARSFRVSYCPMFTQEHEVGSVLGLMEDVTEKIEVEERLKRARRLESLGTLAGGIAHEINQPLNALQLYVSGLEMLLDDRGEVEPEILRTRLSWVLRETAKIHDIITHMRALVRQEGPVSYGPADLNEVVRQALTLITAQMRNHGIEMHLELTSQEPCVKANPVQLEQVIINLTFNAMQALDSLDKQGKRVDIATWVEEGWATLLVRDNGPGLGLSSDRIFDPFYTTSETGRGMGLGLSIVHTFIESWEGVIHARNNEAGGADFLVRLHTA